MENVKSNVIICSICGCPIDESERVETNPDTGEPVCEQCYLEEFSFCACCDEPHAIEDMIWVDHLGYVCQDCIDEVCFQCDDCGEYVVNDERNQVVGERGEVRHVCNNCLENSYFWCEGCGSYHPESEMHWDSDSDCYYCDECWEERCNDNLVLNYHGFSDWQPHYLHSKNEGIMHGFELEVESTNDDDARTVKNYMEDFVVMEHDGSLTEGFEIISHPFTTEYFNVVQASDFKGMLEKLDENGCESGESNSGLHIHVSRECLTHNTALSEDEVIDNIIMIMESFRNELMKFSRRTSENMDEWSSFISTNRSDFEMSYKWIKDNKSNRERYRALNLTNSKTIEFRIFNGTLDFNTFMAALELVDNIVNIARKGNIDGLTWADIVTYGGCYIVDYVNDYNISSDTVLHIVESSQEEYGELIGGVNGKIAYLNDGIELGINNVHPDVVLVVGRHLTGDYLVYSPEIVGHSGEHRCVGSIAEGHSWWVNPMEITLTDIDAYPVHSIVFNCIGFKIYDDNSSGQHNFVYLGSDFKGHSGGSVNCEFVDGTPMENHCWWFYDSELKKFN